MGKSPNELWKLTNKLRTWQYVLYVIFSVLSLQNVFINLTIVVVWDIIDNFYVYVWQSFPEN